MNRPWTPPSMRWFNSRSRPASSSSSAPLSGVTTGGMMPRNGGSVSSDIAAFNQLMFARLLIRPCAVHDRLQVEFARIEHNMLDALSSPRVCNMYESVAGLDHRRVGITIRTIVVFKHERRLPLLAIGRN